MVSFCLQVKALGVDIFLDFKTIIIVGTLLFMLQWSAHIYSFIEPAQFEDVDFISFGFYFCSAVAFMLRIRIRKKLRIPNDSCCDACCCVSEGCSDCLLSCFCLPCVVNQMSRQLWETPPTCECSDKFADIV